MSISAHTFSIDDLQTPELNLTNELTSMAESVIDADSRFSIAKNEADDSPQEDKESGTFLKFKGDRVGRDFELYNFLQKLESTQNTVVSLVEELLLPIKRFSPIAFNVAITKVKTWKIFGEKQESWEEMLDTL